MQNRLLTICIAITISIAAGCAAETMMLGKLSDDTKSSVSKNVENKEPKTVKIGGIEWHVNYDAALKIAKESKKPVWLHFGENPG